MNDFKLTESEKAHPLWLRLRQHLQDQLYTLRSRNDADMDEAQTASLRGRIAMLKSIIALGDDRPIIG